MRGLLLSYPTCKELRSLHSKPYYKKNVNKLKISFSGPHRRNITGKTSINKLEAQAYQKIQSQVLLPRAEVIRALKR